MISLLRAKTKTNPVFYPDRLRRVLDDDPGRLERIFYDPNNVDLLTWNVFQSLDSEGDREYLADLLRPFAGNDLLSPVRLSLWTGRHHEPLLRPSPAYLRHLREQVGDSAGSLGEFTAPFEVPVRMESPNVLTLIDTTLGGHPRGSGGRDRLVELIDAGLEHARSLSAALAVAVVYPSGTTLAAELSAHVNRLRDPTRRAGLMPWRSDRVDVRLREVSWQRLLKMWEREREGLKLGGEPVKQFLEHTRRLGLR